MQDEVDVEKKTFKENESKIDRAYDNFNKFVDHKEEAWYEQTNNPNGIIKELQGEKPKPKGFLDNLDKELHRFRKSPKAAAAAAVA